VTDFLDHKPFDFDSPEVASSLDQLSFWSSRFGALLLDHFPLGRGLTVLDLGCATGFPLFELAQALGPSSRVVGIDPWGRALERASFKRRVLELETAFLVRGDGVALPFRDESFDRVVSNLGINNFDDPAAVLRETHRVLSPGGCVVLTSNVTGHMRELYDVFREILEERHDSEALRRLEANETHRLSAERIGEMLAVAGFSSTRTVEEAFTMRYLDGSALVRHSLVRIGFLDGWRTVAGTAREAEILGELERRLNEKAARDGDLRMTVPMLYIEARKSV
jgi:arsenite methyltransferase